MRVGLVLGAGGVVGASWLIGTLDALEAETGWRAAGAEIVIGTSAGSVIGTLVASGLPAEYLAAYLAGRTLDDLAPLDGLVLPEEADEREEGDTFRLHPGLPALGPGSWRMALSTLRHPLRHPPSAVMCGWLPRGMISTESISRLVDRFVADGWPAHPNTWIVACDYATGRRVAFGREDAPPAAARDAVAASCAIPAFYHPVRIGGHRYVDGGICSVSNADLLCGRGLDLAIVLNPMSSLAAIPARNPAQRLASAMRTTSGRRLGHELRKLREQGTEVLVLQPSVEDLRVMGSNLMARGRREEVMGQARASALRELRSGRVPLPEAPGVHDDGGGQRVRAA